MISLRFKIFVFLVKICFDSVSSVVWLYLSKEKVSKLPHNFSGDIFFVCGDFCKIQNFVFNHLNNNY